MTRILVVFATTDGHTARIARRIAETIQARGADADVVNLAHASPRPLGYDGVIVAASVHAGTYQPELRQWVRTHAARLVDLPAAFISVCLGVLQPEPEVQREVAATIRRFLTSVGWEPTLTKAVAGAVLYTRYGWLKRLVMRRIAAKAGGGTDTSRDYEYTDWADLEQFAEGFAELVARRAMAASGDAHSAPVAVGLSSQLPCHDLSHSVGR